jgi:hypothetical protein
MHRKEPKNEELFITSSGELDTFEELDEFEDSGDENEEELKNLKYSEDENGKYIIKKMVYGDVKKYFTFWFEHGPYSESYRLTGSCASESPMLLPQDFYFRGRLMKYIDCNNKESEFYEFINQYICERIEYIEHTECMDNSWGRASDDTFAYTYEALVPKKENYKKICIYHNEYIGLYHIVMFKKIKIYEWQNDGEYFEGNNAEYLEDRLVYKILVAEIKESNMFTKWNIKLFKTMKLWNLNFIF